MVDNHLQPLLSLLNLSRKLIAAEDVAEVGTCLPELKDNEEV